MSIAIIGAALLPLIAIPAAVYGASVGIGVDNRASFLELLSPGVVLGGLLLFPLPIAAALGAWLASFLAAGLWFGLRVISRPWLRVAASALGSALIVAIGATAGFELLAYAPDQIVGPPVDPLAAASALAIFIATAVPMLLLSGATALLVSSVARRPSRFG